MYFGDYQQNILNDFAVNNDYVGYNNVPTPQVQDDATRKRLLSSFSKIFNTSKEDANTHDLTRALCNIFGSDLLIQNFFRNTKLPQKTQNFWPGGTISSIFFLQSSRPWGRATFFPLSNFFYQWVEVQALRTHFN
jgi:hypothetical protein